ncbi:MAG: malto-oligosyltrehalose synthase [Micrococcus sp.]|nr:malto-oligosyltrehalose synthase [Micrococcus sp.]
MSFEDRAPRSTYRLQITPQFPLAAARQTLDYLHRLGVDWVYLSPLLAAEPGSSHGYDVVDPTRLDPARGTEADLAALAEGVTATGGGVLLDIVPNHVGVATPSANPAWWDLLTHGPDAEHAAWFDVDTTQHGGRVLVPVLGEGTAEDPDAELTHLRLVHEDGQDLLAYFDHRFPLAPATATHGDDPREVHERQHYRLVSWRRGDAELNYRRFFTITTLAGVRVEDEEVFEQTHAAVRRWAKQGWIHGVRVDHPDGLADPAGYFQRLRTVIPHGPVLVEKILEPGESLPAAWPVQGTTGYDALAEIDRVLMPGSDAGQDAAQQQRWHEQVVAEKLAVARTGLRAEISRLVREARAESSEAARGLDGFSDEQLRAGIELLAAHLPVYRTYLPTHRALLNEAAAAAARDSDDPGLVAALHGLAAEGSSSFATRFQQTTGMVMAKGVEDRGFYRYTRWANLNEVGADPSIASLPLEQFHAAQQRRHAGWPAAMTALSTHDTKRGEDTRARIAALAEHPEAVAEALVALERLHPLQDDDAARLLWHSVLGVWPSDGSAPDPDRLRDYALKAAREAGLRTTWTDADEDYEAQLAEAVEQASAPESETRRILQDLADRTAATAHALQLSAKLIQLTAPGVPDVYQGTELVHPTLVDPDNRQEIDYALRRELLAELEAGHRPVPAALHTTDAHSSDARTDEPVARWAPAASAREASLAKLGLTRAALHARRDRPELFTVYRPLDVSGAAAEHIIAFDRGGAVTVAVRTPAALAASGGWRDTTLALPAGRWENPLTGATLDSDGVASLPLTRLLAVAPPGTGASAAGPVALWLRADADTTVEDTVTSEGSTTDAQ